MERSETILARVDLLLLLKTATLWTLVHLSKRALEKISLRKGLLLCFPRLEHQRGVLLPLASMITLGTTSRPPSHLHPRGRSHLKVSLQLNRHSRHSLGPWPSFRFFHLRYSQPKLRNNNLNSFSRPRRRQVLTHLSSISSLNLPHPNNQILVKDHFRRCKRVRARCCLLLDLHPLPKTRPLSSHRCLDLK